jgi:uncharacterized protein
VPRSTRSPSGTAWALILAAWLAFLALGPASAQTFPRLSGRVVDTAGLLSGADRAALEERLRDHEERSGNQIVVATIRSLEGTTIEDYANRLYRAWGLGTRERDNGVLLLVAPNERKVRIEVGYGLEGTLTDALSSVIIATAITPRFRQNDYAGGLRAGVDGILSVLAGDTEEWQPRPKVRDDSRTSIDPVTAIILFLILVFIVSRLMSRGGPRRPHRTRRGGWIILPGPGWDTGWSRGGDWSGGGGWGRGGSSGDGGFSGGGGSSGGGGASGSW